MAKKVQGILKSVEGDTFVVTVKEKQKVEGRKRPVLVESDREYTIDSVKYTKYVLNFK